MPQHISKTSARFSTTTHTAGVFAIILSTLFAPACSEESSPAPQAGALVHTYNLRGKIVSLPDASNPASELRIHHEAIQDFKNAQGEIKPMQAMTMSFPPAPGVSLDGLAVGDVVEFVFRVQWEPTYEMGTTSINKLPPGTTLSFQ
jgi:Cu/Ag efflux protein CusF